MFCFFIFNFFIFIFNILILNFTGFIRLNDLPDFISHLYCFISLLFEFLSTYIKWVRLLVSFYLTGNPGSLVVPLFKRTKRKTEYLGSEPSLLQSLDLYGCSCLSFFFFFRDRFRTRELGFLVFSSLGRTLFWKAIIGEISLWCLFFGHRGGVSVFVGCFRLTPRILRWKYSDIVPWDDYTIVSSGSSLDCESRGDRLLIWGRQPWPDR